MCSPKRGHQRPREFQRAPGRLANAHTAGGVSCYAPASTGSACPPQHALRAHRAVLSNELRDDCWPKPLSGQEEMVQVGGGGGTVSRHQVVSIMNRPGVGELS